MIKLTVEGAAECVEVPTVLEDHFCESMNIEKQTGVLVDLISLIDTGINHLVRGTGGVSGLYSIAAKDLAIAAKSAGQSVLVTYNA